MFRSVLGQIVRVNSVCVLALSDPSNTVGYKVAKIKYEKMFFSISIPKIAFF